MRTPIIAGNWKMNTTVREAVELVREMREGLNNAEGVESVVCPPFVSLTAVGDLVKGTSIGLGAQNMNFEEKGAYTGEISPLMLAELCEYVILGHSERRQYYGETDEIVNKKVKAALKAGLKPIVCVGELLEENEAGKTNEVVTRQVNGALADIPAPAGLVMAYEPVWAIGTGKTATDEQANATCGVIRGAIAKLYGDKYAQEVRIQYGGSANETNIVGLMSQPDIDGALVGGAALKAEKFLSMVEQTAKMMKK